MIEDLVDAVEGVFFVDEGVEEDAEGPDVLFFAAVGVSCKDFGGGVIYGGGGVNIGMGRRLFGKGRERKRGQGKDGERERERRDAYRLSLRKHQRDRF